MSLVWWGCLTYLLFITTSVEGVTGAGKPIMLTCGGPTTKIFITGRIISKDNYRPIALASVVSKVAEIVIYNRISVYLDTCPNQFGFKRNYSSILNGSVFTCFLDASKAFARVNHSILFVKLSNRGIPQCYSNFGLLVWKSADVCSLGWDLFYFFLCY